MPRKNILDNPEYAILLLAIIEYKGQFDVEKKLSQHFVSPNQERYGWQSKRIKKYKASNLSMKILALKRLDFVNSEGGRKYRKHQVNWEKLLKYLLKRMLEQHLPEKKIILSEIERFSKNIDSQEMLKNYFLSAANSQTSINDLLESFAIGLGKTFVIHRHDKRFAEDMKQKKDFAALLAICAIYYLNKLDTPSVVTAQAQLAKVLNLSSDHIS